MSLQMFEKLLNQSQKAGMASTKTKEAKEWFRQKALAVRHINSVALLKQERRFASRIEIGKMYMFSYDPKTKDDLPFYDKLPLIFPFSLNKDGFHGINMHYLPYVYRAKLMDALYTLASDKNYDENTKLRLSYQLLNKTSKFRYFRPCIKQYLNSHIRSSVINIFSDEWDIALFLPLERFEKASKTNVFKDSVRQIGR